MQPKYDREYLERCDDDTLSEIYLNVFGKWYPCHPYALTLKVYAGSEEDPDFRGKAINAILTDKPVPSPHYDLNQDDIY